MVSPCNKPDGDTRFCVPLWILRQPLIPVSPFEKKRQKNLNERKQWQFMPISRQNEESLSTKHFLGESMIISSLLLFEGGTAEVTFDCFCVPHAALK